MNIWFNPGYPALFLQADVNAGDSEGDSPLAHARALMHWDFQSSSVGFFEADRAGDMFFFFLIVCWLLIFLPLTTFNANCTCLLIYLFMQPFIYFIFLKTQYIMIITIIINYYYTYKMLYSAYIYIYIYKRRCVYHIHTWFTNVKYCFLLNHARGSTIIASGYFGTKDGRATVKALEFGIWGNSSWGYPNSSMGNSGT